MLIFIKIFYFGKFHFVPDFGTISGMIFVNPQIEITKKTLPSFKNLLYYNRTDFRAEKLIKFF